LSAKLLFLESGDNMTTANATLPPATQYFFWKLCAWAGPVYLIGSLVGWALIAGFVPPPRADWSAMEITQFYIDNAAWIRPGLVVTIFFQAFWVVMSIALYRLMQCIEGPGGTLSIVQLAGGILNWAIIVGALLLWLTASFRPELRTPQEIMLLSDLGWMTIDVPITGTSIQMVSFGILFLFDKRTTPLFPRWVCWLSFFITTTFIADLLIPFFNHGPFSWHGLISFWVVYSAYFLWVIPVSYYALKAISRLEREDLVR
jgi:hypothetical protein